MVLSDHVWERGRPINPLSWVIPAEFDADYGEINMEEIKQLLKFLNASRSCYHAADQAAQILAANGYIRLWEEQPWQFTSGGKYFALRGDASLIAFRLPRQEAVGFMLAAAHSDSPSFKER